ncbi:MAG: T9SS type A sorting domain-containing protein [bacterium]|nr:T9SS type A sorting domain-containing protein [bacterium]
MGRLLLNMRMASLVLCIAIAGLGYSQTYTFTSGGATGQTPPTQGQIDAAYAGTSLDGAVTVTAGIQYWTVPTTGVYTIEAFGGQGYGSFGGRGAHISGEFNLTAGTQLKILVGQRGGDYLNFPQTTYNNQYGGGGGSFVTDLSNSPYVVAGGGGGSHASNWLPACDGQITEAGAAGAVGAITGAGGTNGNGGLQATSADGGGGLLGNGDGTAGGQAFINGGAAGVDEGRGGFGGGGGTSSWNNYRGGGGGGYSGGGGANNNSSVTCCAAGGGGGSFNGGANPVNLAGVQLGDGQVIISLNCNPTVGSLIADVATLPDLTEDCVLTSWTAPTATNDCNATYIGTPDVSLPINAVGTTTVTWTYDDGTNIITQTQDVIITGIDNDPPVPDNPNLLTFSNQCSFTPATPTATDFCQGVINGTPDVTFPITTQGTTTITWTYDDGFGNTATQTQDVIINDVSSPTPDIATLEDYEGCNSATPTTATATDNCAGTINGVPDVTFPITTAGTTVVTWTYDDGNGNVVTQTQNVNVTLIDLTVSAMGTQLTANQTGATYQWIDCGTGQPIAGAVGQGYQPTVTGEYAAIVTTGSCSDTTECVLVDFTGIDELNSDYINIYPNPTNTGVFTVDFDGVVDHIVVIDALGREVAVTVDLTTGAVDGSNLEAGRYTVRVFASDAVYSKGLVIVE